MSQLSTLKPSSQFRNTQTFNFHFDSDIAIDPLKPSLRFCNCQLQIDETLCNLFPPRETLLSTLCHKWFNLTLNSFCETAKPLRSLLSSRFRKTISPPPFQPTMMRSLPSSRFRNTISPFIFSTCDDVISSLLAVSQPPNLRH